jgi:hypothetical protein
MYISIKITEISEQVILTLAHLLRLYYLPLNYDFDYAIC